jgi:8-hydroxy-5-deazaflavin:NADPH oxidoreductase
MHTDRAVLRLTMTKERIGIIGAGLIGTALATKFSELGYDVVISNSRGPETLADLVEQLGPRVTAATATEAGAAGDLVVVTVPLKALGDVPVEPLAGKIVLDTNNYYWERDGRIPVLDEARATTSGLLQAHLPQSKVAKAFNHIGYDAIGSDGTPAGTPNRRALATASDFDEAAELVTRIYDEFGFDTVNIGDLEESWRVERDQPAYVRKQNRHELLENLALAKRIPAAA